MALVVADRVQETTTTTGTGTITLAGAVSGFQSFAAIGDGNTTFYCIVSGTAWEVGIGTYTSVGTTLARTTILASSAAGAAITLAGTSTVFCTLPGTAPAAQAGLYGFATTATAGATTTLTNKSSVYQVFTGSSAQTIALPSTATLTQGWFFHLVNNSTGTLTVQTSTAVSLGTIPPGVTMMASVIDITVNTAAGWETGYTDFSTLTGTGNNVLSTSPTISYLSLAAGTTTAGQAPLKYVSGNNLTTAETGATEFDGTNFYATIDTSSGRGMVPTEQYFRLSAAGTGITATATGTNYFGANSNIALVANAYYEIEIVAWFLKTTATTAVWNLVFNVAPIAYNVEYSMSPITGIVAPPGSATLLVGHAYNQTAATYAVTTGSLTTAVNHFARFKLWVRCSATTTSMKINVFNGAAGTITPGIGSYWKCRRLSPGSVGTFVA